MKLKKLIFTLTTCTLLFAVAFPAQAQSQDFHPIDEHTHEQEISEKDIDAQYKDAETHTLEEYMAMIGLSENAADKVREIYEEDPDAIIMVPADPTDNELVQKVDKSTLNNKKPGATTMAYCYHSYIRIGSYYRFIPSRDPYRPNVYIVYRQDYYNCHYNYDSYWEGDWVFDGFAN